MKKHLLLAFCMLSLACSAYSQPSLIPYRLYAKWGYADLSGKLLIPAQYDHAYKYQEECAIVKAKGKYGLIDSTGKLLLPIIYDEIGHRKWKGHTFYMLYVRKKFGLANTAGKVIAPAKYDDLVYESEWSYATATAGKASFRITPEGIITKGEDDDRDAVSYPDLVEALQKDFVEPFRQNNKFGYLVRRNKRDFDTIPAMYDAIDEINIYDNVLRVKKDGHWGVIGPKNNILFPFLYEEMGHASPAFSFYAGKRNGKYGILKKDGTVLVPFEWDELNFAYEGYWCMVTSKGKKGIIILDGNTPVVIAPKYKNIPGNPADVYQQVRFFEVGTAQGTGYVREDGTDYFKDGKR